MLKRRHAGTSAISVLRAAGAAVPPRPLAGRHRAGDRANAGIANSSGASPTSTASFRATGRFTMPMDVGLSNADAALDRVSFADVAAPRTVRLAAAAAGTSNYACRDDYGALAPRRVRLGRAPLLRVARQRRKGPAHLARGQWLDRQAAAARVGRFVRTGATVSARSSRDGRSFRVRAGDAEYRLPTRSSSRRRRSSRRYLIEGMAPLRHVRVFAVDHGEPDARLDSRCRARRAGVGQRDHDSPTLGYVDAMHQSLRTRRRSHGLDVLLGAGRRDAGRQPLDAARRRTGVLEGSDPDRSRARASAHSIVRVAG